LHIARGTKMFYFKLRDFLNRYFEAIMVVIALPGVIFITMIFGFKVALIIILAVASLLVVDHIFRITVKLVKEIKHKNICNSISNITDPNEKISALESYLKNTIGPDQAYNSLHHDSVPIDKSQLHLKAALIFCLVNTCIEKGDFETAIRFCEEVLTIYPISDDIYSDEEITYKDQCILLISSCMMCRYEFEKARAMLKFLKNKGFRCPAAKYKIDTQLMALAINTGDAQEARRLLGVVMPEAVRADKTFPEYGIMYELKLNEAMIDILENKHEDAKEKLNDILNNCIFSTVRKRVQQLYDEKFI